MRKYIVFCVGFMAMLMAAGCSAHLDKDRGISKSMIVGDEEIDAQDMNEKEEAEEALILLFSNEEETKPYVRWLWKQEWTGNNWLHSDAIPFAEEIDRYGKEIPEIIYDSDFSVSYKEGVSFLSVSVYEVESPFERIEKYTDLSKLEELPEGNYYIGITVQEQGKFIEAEEKYEAVGYECIYWMIK